jgi:hypothetical protein
MAVVYEQPDTYSTTVRLAPRDRVAIADASDPIQYQSPYPNSTQTTRVVTWTWANT